MSIFANMEGESSKLSICSTLSIIKSSKYFSENQLMELNKNSMTFKVWLKSMDITAINKRTGMSGNH
jgi:hypothetical protein